MELPDLVCPHPDCLSENTVRIDMAGGETVACTSCETEFNVDDIRSVVASWGPFLAWVDLHPARQAEAAVQTADAT